MTWLKLTRGFSMSGTVEFKINGNLIGHIYYHNEGYIDDDLCAYTYEYYSWPNKKVMKGNLEHLRSEGVEVLVHKILIKLI